MLRKTFHFCGIFSSLIYASSDMIGGMQLPDYSWIHQEYSRLSAVGSPSRPIHLVLTFVYTLLVIAFGLGVWQSAGRKRSLRVIGGALILYAIGNCMWPQFFPEDLSKPASALTNTMHIILTFLTVFTWIIILSLAIVTSGKAFQLYSIGTLVAVIVFGSLAGSQGPALAAGQPTPWLGLTERINIYSFMVWVVVLAISLLCVPAERSQDSLGEEVDK
jgi:hypothetical protein